MYQPTKKRRDKINKFRPALSIPNKFVFRNALPQSVNTGFGSDGSDYAYNRMNRLDKMATNMALEQRRIDEQYEKSRKESEKKEDLQKSDNQEDSENSSDNT